VSADASFRGALRWYPKAWRRANEDVVVGTLMDVADAEGRTAPTREERRDLRRAGVGTRADFVLPGAIRDRVAAISLGAGTGLALALGTGQLWSPWNSQGSPAEPQPETVVWQVLIHPGLWILAALATLVGWTVVARVLLIGSLPASAIAIFSTEVSFTLRPSFFALVMMGVLALAACIGRPPRRWLLIATGLTGAAFASWITWLGPFPGTYFPRGGSIDFMASPMPAALLVIATAVFLLRSKRTAAASVMIAAFPWLTVLIGRTLWYGGFMGELSYLFRPLVIVAIAVIIPLAIVLVARRYAAAPVGFGPWLSPSESSDSRTSASRPSSTR
jgi:hypothetical protein